MTSILSNTSAQTALSTLRSINSDLESTQNRISTGMDVSSAKDNAASFSIAETMRGDSGMTQAINDGLTMTKNAVATARLGAEQVADLAQEFVETVALANGEGVDLVEVQKELDALAERMDNTIKQATFNGENYVDNTDVTAVTSGIERDASGAFTGVSTMDVTGVDLAAIQTALAAIDVSSSGDVAGDLATAEAELEAAIGAEVDLGITEKSIETQQDFLTQLTDTLDSGVGALVDADMEEEAARLQALQVQQQLASQSLSIANSQPENVLSLFQ